MMAILAFIWIGFTRLLDVYDIIRSRLQDSGIYIFLRTGFQNRIVLCQRLNDELSLPQDKTLKVMQRIQIIMELSVQV